MCGIAGIFTARPTASEALLDPARRMRDHLRHRGPDGDGQWSSPGGHAVLQHTRLAIIGLGEAGRQPKTDAGHALTFNGEIYNYRALRRQLDANGIQVKTPTDSEVLLSLLRHHAHDALSRLRGMFAFAHWDESRRQGRLVRDPLGIKPVYYHLAANGDLYFASEIRALMASGKIERKLSAHGLYGFLRMGSVPEPHTMVEGIRLLPAGCELHWQNGRIKLRQYSTANQPATTAETPDLRAALLETTRHHFESDVPVGIFLSGGKDSAALLSLARQIGIQKIKTYTVGCDTQELDESESARAVAKHFDSEHVELKLERRHAEPLLDAFLADVDQPTLDGFNTWTVSRLAHHDGAKVVLSGLGSDELFGGYSTFRSAPRLVQLSRQLRPFTSPITKIARLIGGLAHDNRFNRAAEFLAGAPTLGRAYTALRGAFSHAEAADIGRELGIPIPPIFQSEFDFDNELPTDNDISNQDVSRQLFTRYLRNQLLRDSDVMSMAHSLELRVPFVDHSFLASASALPDESRFRPGKTALTDAVGNLPTTILNRTRKGFTLPFQQWYSKQLRERLAQRPHLSRISRDTWYRSWSLVVLLDWIKRHNLSTT